MNNLYALYGAQFSVSGEMKQKEYTSDSIDFGIAFSKADLEWFSFKDGAADFFEKGPASDADGIQVKIATPLLIDFIKSTDVAVAAHNNVAASLRFTHAEAISPFATLLGISGASTSSPSVFTYTNYWKASSAIPMSANIQWIIYSNGKEYLVRYCLMKKKRNCPFLPLYFLTIFGVI